MFSFCTIRLTQHSQYWLLCHKTPQQPTNLPQKLERIQLLLCPLQRYRPAQRSDPPAEIETPKKAPDESHQSRPRRTINRPSHLKDYVM
ncbi:hypothetical protein AVEN_104384-1 [Araneus ventricosus]|uniref:Uncharacterized protein n=1 Tax=Araneus ventricosus TaxID=182803 RepID=A0A4Y2MAZ8_ARAVE|nr:hypothetical protein AVEN_104384-1 [Araneus ventricosus]